MVHRPSHLPAVIGLSLVVAAACAPPVSSGSRDGSAGAGGGGGSGGGGSGSGGGGGNGGGAGSGGSGGTGGTGGTIGGSGGSGGWSGKGLSYAKGTCGALYECIVQTPCTTKACSEECVKMTGAKEDVILLYNQWNDCVRNECCVSTTACGEGCSDPAKTCKKECGSCKYRSYCAGAGADGTGTCWADRSKICRDDADCPPGSGVSKAACVSGPDPMMAKCAEAASDCLEARMKEIPCPVRDKMVDKCGGGGP